MRRHGGSVALVTGGSRGIGRAVAQRLAGDGSALLVNYRNDRAAAEEVVAGIGAAGGRAVAAAADVSDPEQVRGLFDTAEREFGGLDVVVHNAGGARFSRIADSTDADFAAMFALNAQSTFTALRESAARVRADGRVVVVSSNVVRGSTPGTGLYSAAKAAADQLVRVFAAEVADRGITVNSVRPGAVRTEALAELQPPEVRDRLAGETPLGRLGEPSDIAGVVAFLASDAGRWITGQALTATGGA